ncbi:uncharacterized protein LOC114297281 [Camellia sinensis]|uniref:uncharacterized protein LOC114297281 n=1 Tax=Camellia sinensis TaxID=4442 RepID=UPI001036B5E0|nr:uncharacterized protein LOC114297281 [Camellia sinensis]
MAIENIYEERAEKMISHKDGKSTFRIARFLKPCTKHLKNAVPIPNTPLLSDIFPHNLQQWPSEVQFRGWKLPHRKWKEWVERLARKHSKTWKKAGICDAILSSLYEVRRDKDLVLGLSEFWCPEINTFVFPWGEATITLEDIMVLGGYSVLGKPVTSPLPKDLLRVEHELRCLQMEMSRRIKQCMENTGESEFKSEHVAFLTYWLSRHVFPSISEKTIGKHIFPIAAHLSVGARIALAPAVLSSLYRDLRLLHEQAITSSQRIVVFAPFQLVQLWALERFPLLGPKTPNSLELGQPRAARWHKLNSKINLPLVRSALRLPENFLWRPYASDLKNWRHLSYYKETEQFVSDRSCFDDEIKSYIRSTLSSNMVGIGCVEKYSPRRVAMQFGMDQDLPTADHLGSKTGLKHVGFFVQSRFFEPSVSVRYLKWWDDFMFARKRAIRDASMQKAKMMMKKASSSSVQPKMNEKNCHYSRTQIIRDWTDDEADLPSKISSKIETKNSEGDFHASNASNTPKISNKISKVSKEIANEEKNLQPYQGSSIEKIHQDSGVSSKTQIIRDWTDEGADLRSKRSSKIKTRNRKGDFHASNASSTPKIPKKISKFSKEIVNEENNLQRYQGSSIGKIYQDSSVWKRTRSSRKGNVVPSSSTMNRKRKLSSKEEGNLKKKGSIDIVNHFDEELDFVLLREMMKQNKSKEESVKVVAVRESYDNPVNVDDWKMEISATQFQELELSIEGRFQRIEKRLGINPTSMR